MKADLHCHTMLSDGTLGIEELIQVAKKSGVDTIAITDHDTLAGTVRAAIIGKRFNINVITGVELSCWDDERNRKVHLLCYMPDHPDRLEGLCMRTSEFSKAASRSGGKQLSGGKRLLIAALILLLLFACASKSTTPAATAALRLLT